MIVVTIDVLDGKGLTDVVVRDGIDAMRLRVFFREAMALFDQRDELLSALLYVQQQVESGQEIAMSQVNAAIRNASGKS
jgi:hypothetical protein